MRAKGPTKVTLKWLEKHHACGHAKSEFIKRFLRGKRVSERGKIGIDFERVLSWLNDIENRLTAIAPYRGPSWRSWLLSRLGIAIVADWPPFVLAHPAFLSAIHDLINERHTAAPAALSHMRDALKDYNYCK